MKYINIFFLILIILIFLCIIIEILNYSKNKPHLYKNLNIKNLSYLDFDYFKNYHGNEYIYLRYSNNNINEMKKLKIKKIRLIDYCNNLMKNKNWYFKSEDQYDFLSQIGIKKKIIKEFDSFFDKKKYNIQKKCCSFWMGPKYSTTGWHTDIDDLSYLYVVKGKKKIQLISPKYNYAMYENDIYTHCARWSNVDFKNIDYKKYPKFKNVKIYKYILNQGDCIYIPKNWWHCVENLEDTIAITYKIYRVNKLILIGIYENIRKKFYSKIDYIDDAKLLLENKIS